MGHTGHLPISGRGPLISNFLERTVNELLISEDETGQLPYILPDCKAGNSHSRTPDCFVEVFTGITSEATREFHPRSTYEIR